LAVDAHVHPFIRNLWPALSLHSLPSAAAAEHLENIA